MGYYLKCVCGYPFNDALGYEHQSIIVPRVDAEDVDNSLCEDFKAFFRAIANGRRDTWVREIFPEPYPLDVDDADVLNDLVQRHAFSRSKRLLHCPDCGRIHIQLQHEHSLYRSFVREEPGPPNPQSVVPKH